MLSNAMTSRFSRWAKISSSLQLVLIVATFSFDFIHGIALGQHQVWFHPIFRYRATLAVSISRMHEPPPHGYLAYQSVADALIRAGFPKLPDEGGPDDSNVWDAFFADTAKVDGTLQAGRDAVIDPNLPPRIITGNELAFADYVYYSFELFGLHRASLYYFWFLLLGLSCVLFVAEFRSSRFLMLLLLMYLAGLGFLENYIQSQDPQWGTSVANSRFFDALSLLPAIHVFLVAWRRQAPRLPSVTTVLLQSCLLAFIVDCRITARWQVAMIAALGVGMVLVAGWKARLSWPGWRAGFLNGAWAAGIAVAALAIHMASVDLSADARYRTEPMYHVVWHEALRGLLGSSTELQRVYLGKIVGLALLRDQDAYDAVNFDLNKRNDRSSPIAVVDHGRIAVEVARGWNEYERMARGLVVDMIVHHPGAVIVGLYNKFAEQMFDYTVRDAMSFRNLAAAILVAALGGFIWLSSGGLNSKLASGAGATLFVLAFATIPPIIVPSPLSVGTLLAYTIAAGLAASAVVILLVRAGAAVSRSRRGLTVQRPSNGAR
jgi:hypothetical protein